MSPSDLDGGRLPVLFLVPSLEVGGAERQLVEVVVRMDPARFVPAVACQKGFGPFAAPLRAAGVRLAQVGTGRRLDPIFPLRLARLCRELRPAAIVLYGFSTSVVGRVVGRVVSGSALILADHGYPIPVDSWRGRVDRWLAGRTDAVIAVAPAQVDGLVERGFERDRITVIPNGVDPREWRPRPPDPALRARLGVPEDALLVGMIAQMRPEKNHAALLRATALLDGTGPEVHTVLVGRGEQMAGLQALAAELGISRRAHLVGQQLDVARWLATFDAVVLTSSAEALPMALLEAMSMARPVVATRLSGVSELILDGDNGFLVPVDDAVALAAGLATLRDDPGLRREMGRRSRAVVVERFAVSRMVSATESLIERTVRTKRRSSC